MPNLVTIKDIARALNISVSTVSRALRDTYDVSLETKSKVHAMASELQYKPNFNATGLANGKTHNIGIIIPFITNYYFSTVITGIQEAAYKSNYNIILYVTNDSAEREVCITQELSIASLDGLLVSSCCDTGDHFHKHLLQGMPIVFFDRVIDSIEASKVMQDDYNGAYQATAHLIEQGYTKIAHITGPKGQALTSRRLKGYLDAMKRFCLPIKEEWVVHSGFSQNFGEADTLGLLQLPKNSIPNAIFAVNDRKAVGATLALKKKNIAIGRKIGVIGFTDDPISSLLSPTISTIAEPAFDIGYTSCELLLQHIYKKNKIREEITLSGELIIRESTQRNYLVNKRSHLPSSSL
ncbi:LacI family DNA-binding transcriptional regulator [Olivibacter sp. SDN3]|uniref:LacI family DNA-binding transcriptional regulator n=1 Tax=Olivibacter sp. SDN3 TaxID=2764720 RepID=UPI0016517820|nr:LacI family DNA-binding transcriptional regulator [Olivibacter sp. SDN3]QNL50396.1 LacI family DNA-binding transcriptional regulator [Olivibacter sp. SDN3]